MERWFLFGLTVVLALLQAALLGLLVSITTARPSFSQPLAGSTELLDMARTIWAESANQPPQGQLAVGFVILNRIAVDPERYGSTVAQVVRKPGQFAVWSTKRRRARLMALDGDHRVAGWPQAKAAAALVLRRAVRDPTHGSTHFYATTSIRPAWARGKPVIRIGNHVFLRTR